MNAGPITVAGNLSELATGSDGFSSDKVATISGDLRASSIVITPPEQRPTT